MRIILFYLMITSIYAQPFSSLITEEEVRVMQHNYQVKASTFRSYKRYHFAQCHKFNSSSREEYFVNFQCDSQALSLSESYSSLSDDIFPIAKKTYEDHALRSLLQETTHQLGQSRNFLSQKIQNLQLVEPLSFSQCQEEKNKDHISCLARAQYQEFRKLLALKDLKKDAQLRDDLKLEVSNKNPSPLSKGEREELDQELSALRQEAQQSCYLENLHQYPCLEVAEDFSIRVKPQCDLRSKRKTFYNGLIKDCQERNYQEISQRAQERYFDLLEKNPFLVHMNVTSESDSFWENTVFSYNQMKESVQFVTEKMQELASSSSRPRELLELLNNDLVVESFLKKDGPTQMMCDSLEKLRREYQNERLIKDTAAVIGTALPCLAAGASVIAAPAALAICSASIIAYAVPRLNSLGDQLRTEYIHQQAGIDNGKKAEELRREVLLTAGLMPLEGLMSLKYGSKFLKSSEAKVSRSPASRVQVRSDLPSTEFKLVDESVNQNWIDIAKADNGFLYLDVENAALKGLNDSLGDKNLVTQLTNLHKQILNDKIKNALPKNLLDKVQIHTYSDFKSVRYSFTEVQDLTAREKDLLKSLLNRAYLEANHEFAIKVRHLDQVGEINLKAETPDVESWFLSGMGETADQAGIAAKKGREIIQTDPRIRTYQFQSQEVTQRLQSEVTEIQRIAQSFQKSDHPFHSAGLLETYDSSFVPKLEVFEILRKEKSVASIQETFFKRYAIQLSEAEANDLLRYSSQLDSLTPGLWIAKREVANLDAAEAGGMSGDITGMGAQNVRQVALDLAQGSDSSVEDLLIKLREGEAKVTEEVSRIKDEFHRTVVSTLDSEDLIQACSGDDCILIVKDDLTTEHKEALVRAFASKPKPTQFRLSFIPKGIEQASERTNIAVDGELIEKAIRRLKTGMGEGEIPPEVFNDLTIATSMPKNRGSGKVDLIIGLGNQRTLNQKQKDILKEALEEAIRQQDQAYEAGLLHFVSP